MNPFLNRLQYLTNSICDSPTQKGEGNKKRIDYSVPAFCACASGNASSGSFVSTA
jgi:hypothetical protein